MIRVIPFTGVTYHRPVEPEEFRSSEELAFFALQVRDFAEDVRDGELTTENVPDWLQRLADLIAAQSLLLAGRGQ
jgi:hypothetical protein